MPGLIDSHVHVVASSMDLTLNAQLPDALAILRSLSIMKGMLDRGFTTVRDVGGAPAGPGGGDRGRPDPGAARRRLRQGAVEDGRPRRQSPPPSTRMTRPAGPATSAPSAASPTASTRCAAPARQELRQGARFIKVMANGGVSSPTDPIAWQGYSVSELTAIVEEARDAQTYVSAHLYTARRDHCGRCTVASIRSNIATTSTCRSGAASRPNAAPWRCRRS